jgi:regulator of replication initiation timing
MAENKKREQLLKGNRRNHKEINRRNPLHMIAKEGFHVCNGRSRRDTM